MQGLKEAGGAKSRVHEQDTTYKACYRVTLSQFIGLYKLRKKAFLTKKKYKKCIFSKETYIGHPKRGGFSLHETRNSWQKT